MSATLQSPPRKKPAPPPRRRSPNLLVILVPITLLLGIGLGAVLWGGNDQPEQVQAVAAQQAEPAADDEGTAATRADDNAVDAADSAGGVRVQAAQPRARGNPGSDSAVEGSPQGPLAGMTDEEIAALPDDVRKRLRARQREYDGLAPVRPDRQPRKATSPAIGPRPPARSTFGPPPEPGPNRLEVTDQQGAATAVRLTRVATSRTDALVVVQRLTENGPGAVLGVKSVTKGASDNVAVRLDEPLSGRTQLVVSLYRDTFERGVFVDGQDQIIRGPSGRPILSLITVTP